ncbi:MAG: hypothetical protein PQJ46_06730 [Spirochaetales bacterium]|nr:hypothetical protein [Spirochaetales bacterium]
MITAPTGDVLSMHERIIDQYTDGKRVRFEVQKQDGFFYLLFLNEVDGDFPVCGEGSYIIKRNLTDGKFVQVKVFLKDNPGCYVRLFPMDERAVMEIYLYGKKVYSKINLPFSFADILIEPFSEIINSTINIVNWDLVLGNVKQSLFAGKKDMLQQIRYYLPDLKDADDGAIDFDGSYVYIETLAPQPEGEGGLNCSGFVKWVADGIFLAETGKYMSIKDLKEKHLDERGNRWSRHNEEERDPYFGLDWSRNIAVSIEDASYGDVRGYKSADVDDVPWSKYTPDVGFPIKDLKLVMYYLAIMEPENIYIASVNVPWGTEPILQQHIHVVVLLPLIDENKDFKDLIFERNFESDSESLIKRYPNAHIHLVRIKTVSGIHLPEVTHKRSIDLESLLRR